MATCPVGGDASRVIVAVELLRCCLETLEDARRTQRDRNDIAFWSALIHRLEAAEDCLYCSDLPEAYPFAQLVTAARTKTLTALTTDTPHSSPIWANTTQLITAALASSTTLAATVEQSLLASHTSPGPSTFVPLTEIGTLGNPDQLLSGLRLAARLGIDLNTVLIGLGNGEATARSIQGSVGQGPPD
jgi:hypothetical protein